MDSLLDFAIFSILARTEQINFLLGLEFPCQNLLFLTDLITGLPLIEDFRGTLEFPAFNCGCC